MNAKRRFAPWMAPLLLAPALVTCGGNERVIGPHFEQFGTSTQLAFLNQPANVGVGIKMAQINVAIEDAQGQIVTTSTASVTIAITPGTGTPGAILKTKLTRNAINGVVGFEVLTIDRAGTGYTFTVTSSGLNSAVSAPFDVGSGGPGPATRLGVVTQPSAVTAGAAITPAVQIAVQDANGVTVTTSTANVTVAITGGTGTAGAVLGGTLTQAAVNGIATFNNLSLDKSGTGYTVTGSSTGLTNAVTAAFNVSAGAASTLVFTAQPTTAGSGSPITPAVQVTVQDAQGNTVTGSAAGITLTITGGTGTAGAVLSGTLTRNASNGVATFPGLSIDKVGNGYTLAATSSGLTSATSSAFDISLSAATKLAYTIQPSDAVSGSAIAPAVRVAVQDAQGNVATGASVSITLAITGGTGTAGAVLGGSATQAAVNGVATFNNLSVDKAGTGYTLTATASGLSPAVSSGFDIAVGAAVKLAFSMQPSNALVGAAIAPAVQVTVQDAQGNTVTGSSASITMAIASGTGTAGATLGGALTHAASGGIATFNNLSIDLAGAGYALTASAPALAGATSNAFTISTVASNALVIANGASSAIAGKRITPPWRFVVKDGQGNIVTSFTGPVTLALTPGTGTPGAVISGPLTVNASNGVIFFEGLSVDKAGTAYTVTATASGLTSGTSNPFNITSGVAAGLAVTTQPTSVTIGTAITPALKVTVQDGFGNTVTSSSASITLAITTGTGTSGALLGGTVTQAAVNGVATFANLTVSKTGTGYTLTGTASGLTGTVSAAFNVTAAPATKLAFSAQPTTVTAGTSMAPAVQVTVQDAGGNTVVGSTAPLTLAITTGTGTGGAVLGGTLTQNAVNGVATFANLSVNLAGTGYTLAGTSPGLTSAVSAAFAVNAAGGTLTIQKFLGDNQTALVAYATNIRPAVRILNGAVPVAGVAVTFAVTGGGGSITGNAVVTTNTNGVAQVGSWVVGAGAGANALTATGAGSYSGSNNVAFAATGQTGQYHVEVRNVGPAFTPAVQAAFDAAAAHWESIIYGDQANVPINTNNACGLGVTINQTVDDVIILARFDSIDGPGQILGSAGACSIRTSNGLTIYGAMQFDTADVAGLIASGSLNAVILHEMGHVLGFSSGTWNTQAGITQQRVCAQLLTSGNPPFVTHPDTHFDCTQSGATNFARAAFDSIGGTTYSGGLKVPLENCTGVPASCGAGTYNSHWRESTFGNELMTGYLNNGANPLTLLTIASFQDEGYLVNYAAAEAYSHVFPAAGMMSNTRINLGDDRFNVPIDVVDDRSGVVMRVIPKQP